MNAQKLADRNERGQALVLIVLAIGVIFGFGALAVDFGQIYASRRQAQNAADAAALAAAYDAVQGSKDPNTAVNIGYTLAATNGFNNDGVTNWVVVNNPPIGGPYCFPCTQDPTKYEYYQVKITVRNKPIFAQVVFSGAEQTTVEAIAHAATAGTVSAGDTIHALSTDTTALDLNGNIKIEVNGGNIRSNGGIVKNGSSGYIRVAEPGHVYYGLPYPSGFNGQSGPFSPAKPEHDKAPMVSSMRAPYCPTAAEAASWSSGNGFKYNQINGVNYYYYPNGLSVENLPKGIHCVQGGIGKGNYVGRGILIVLLSGGIQQTGNDSVNFRSAPDLIDANGTQWGGMVFYAPESNKEVLKFGGNSGAYFQGTVYAPGATCDIGGTEDGSADHTSIICYHIKFHGTPVLKINYDSTELFHFPPMVELVQ